MRRIQVLRYPSKRKWWEGELRLRLDAMRAWAEVCLVMDEAEGQVRLISRIENHASIKKSSLHRQAVKNSD
jgi:hypothetical protein